MLDTRKITRRHICVFGGVFAGRVMYDCSYNWKVSPGCNRSSEINLDKTSMDPRTPTFTVQDPVLGDPIDLKITCEVCPEDPVQ